MPDNDFLLDEIRLNRQAIRDLGERYDASSARIHDEVDKKVGRGELFGWLGATATIVGLLIRFGA